MGKNQHVVPHGKEWAVNTTVEHSFTFSPT